MDELIDTLDVDGNSTGKTCLKSEAHKKGLWHPCIHVWLYTKNGEVLIQKRIATKDTFPNRWDVSVAGHIGAGEDVLLAAQREVFEELGVSIEVSDFQFIGNHKTDIEHNENLIDREFHYIYITEFKNAIDDLILQEEEVSDTRLIPINQLKNLLSTNKFVDQFVPYSEAYITKVFQAIKQSF